MYRESSVVLEAWFAQLQCLFLGVDCVEAIRVRALIRQFECIALLKIVGVGELAGFARDSNWRFTEVLVGSAGTSL